MIERFDKLKTTASEIRGKKITDKAVVVAWLTFMHPQTARHQIDHDAKFWAKKISYYRKKIEKLAE